MFINANDFNNNNNGGVQQDFTREQQNIRDTSEKIDMSMNSFDVNSMFQKNKNGGFTINANSTDELYKMLRNLGKVMQDNCNHFDERTGASTLHLDGGIMKCTKCDFAAPSNYIFETGKDLVLHFDKLMANIEAAKPRLYNTSSSPDKFTSDLAKMKNSLEAIIHFVANVFREDEQAEKLRSSGTTTSNNRKNARARSILSMGGDSSSHQRAKFRR